MRGVRDSRPSRQNLSQSQNSGSSRQLPENINRRQFNMPMTVTFPKNIIGFPDRLVTILKYSENYTFTGSATPAAQVWSINSAFDPNFTGTGHQPSFYDTFQSVYGRYFVRHFKLDLEVTATNPNVSTYVVANYADQSIAANTVEQIIEAKYSVFKVLGITNSGKSTQLISLPWMSTMKLMGQPGTEADDNMYSVVSASPADVAWALVKGAAVDGTTSTSFMVRAVIYQEIVFKDLLPQISS